MNPEDKFYDWFHELESFGLRSERFHLDTSIDDTLVRDISMVRWLKAAYINGAKDMLNASVKFLKDQPCEGEDHYKKHNMKDVWNISSEALAKKQDEFFT